MGEARASVGGRNGALGFAFVCCGKVSGEIFWRGRSLASDCGVAQPGRVWEGRNDSGPAAARTRPFLGKNMRDGGRTCLGRVVVVEMAGRINNFASWGVIDMCCRLIFSEPNFTPPSPANCAATAVARLTMPGRRSRVTGHRQVFQILCLRR